jgi:hypothetical protein
MKSSSAARENEPRRATDAKARSRASSMTSDYARDNKYVFEFYLRWKYRRLQVIEEEENP